MSETAVQDKAEFEIIGTIGAFWPDRGGKVVRFQVRVRGDREKILDLKYFGVLPAYGRGDRVRVLGEPGSEKTGQTETGKNGKIYDKYVPLLVAKRVEALSKAQATIAGVNDNARARPREDDDIPF